MPIKTKSFLLLSGVLLVSSCAEKEAPVVDKREPSADFIMRDVQRTSYDLSGDVVSELQAESVKAYRTAQRSTLSKLVFNIERAGQNWLIYATEGEYENNNLLLLNGDVNIKRLDSNKSTDFSLLTAELAVDFEAEKAFSKQPVTLNYNNGQFIAKTLDIDLKNLAMKLDKPKGHYEASQRPN